MSTASFLLRMTNRWAGGLLALSGAMFACLIQAPAQAQSPAPDLKTLQAQARAQGQLVTVGMPDDWANWKGVFGALKQRHGIARQDADMSSAEQIARLEAERGRPVTDLGDVGFEFGAIAKARGLTQAYKPSTWAQVPDWAKDAEGHWALAYTGTIAFAINTQRVKQLPDSWKALFSGQYRVMVGEVGRSSQANAAVLSAAVALGGSETDLTPALKAFAPLARAGRLLQTNPTPALMERAEADVFILWDFNALSYRAKLPVPAHYTVLIPKDGSITSGYSTLIPRTAPRPQAAMMAREFIFSDEGQLLIAKGWARPIRVDQLQMPAELKAQLLDSAQYAKARGLKAGVWTEEVKKLPRAWQRDVLAGGA